MVTGGGFAVVCGGVVIVTGAGGLVVVEGVVAAVVGGGAAVGVVVVVATGGHGAGHCAGQGLGTGQFGGITQGTHGGWGGRGFGLLVAIVPLFPRIHCGQDPGLGRCTPVKKIKKGNSNKHTM